MATSWFDYDAKISFFIFVKMAIGLFSKKVQKKWVPEIEFNKHSRLKIRASLCPTQDMYPTLLDVTVSTLVHSILMALPSCMTTSAHALVL